MMNDRELAAVLTGLRLVQWERGSMRYALGQIMTDGGRFEPLNDDEIDQLCEKLNTANEIDPRIKKHMEDPSVCLYCGSKDISAGLPEYGDSIFWGYAECYDCGGSWHDVYRLIGVDPNWPEE